METNLGRVEQLMHARTPQDFAAIQSDFVRDNVEGVLHSGRRVAEMSLQIADSAAKKMTDNMEAARRAAA